MSEQMPRAEPGGDAGELSEQEAAAVLAPHIAGLVESFDTADIPGLRASVAELGDAVAELGDAVAQFADAVARLAASRRADDGDGDGDVWC
jgi:hypothetical protein